MQTHCLPVPRVGIRSKSTVTNLAAQQQPHAICGLLVKPQNFRLGSKYSHVSGKPLISSPLAVSIAENMLYSVL